MIAENEVDLLKSSLEELRSNSLRRIVLLLSGVCYAGFIWALWPVNTGSARQPVALLCLVLAAVAGLTYMARRRFLELAALLLIGALLACLGAAAVIFRQAEIAHLFIVPVIFSSVLLGQSSILLVAFAAAVITLALTGAGIPGSLLLLPLIMLSVVTVAVMIATRNLYTALTWALNGYESAFRNQNIARDRKAELEQALKSLEIASHNLYRANHALENARNQAEEARRLKQHFAQTISHELRTPLNLIVGFTETMIQSPEYYGSGLPPLYMRDLTIVYRNACHLQSLVNDVLDLARVETAQMSLQMEETDLTAIAVEAVNTARSLVETRGLRFCADIASNLPTVWADPIRIKQIIFNLLNNAARFTEHGSVTLQVAEHEEEVAFAVIDTGIGIASEHLEHIFEPFRQLGNPLRRRTGGAGLGLTISLQLAHLHGGHIRVESQPGVGSTFTFSLPTNPAELLPQSSDAKLTPVSPRRSKDDLVLLVTSSPSAAAMIARYLRTCRAIIVPDMDQAVHAAQQMLPQAVIIDTSDAPLAAEQLSDIAATWGLSQTCFIACPLQGEGVLQQRLAVQGYLIKPIYHDDLWDTLHQFGEQVNTIMVVDDDRDFVRLIERMLDNPLKRYRVITAYGGREALALLRYGLPDLILLDLEMPDLDGFQVIESLRANPDWQNLRVVVVSGQAEWDTTNLITGSVTITKAPGITSGEILKWLQGLVGFS